MSLILNKFIGAGEVVEDAINDAELLKAPSQNAVFDALALKVNSSLIGANNGVATLDAQGKLPSSQLTIEAFEYKGNYDATGNSPSLSNGVGSTGDVYHVSVAGSRDFGAGSISFIIGDKVVYNGTIYEKWEVSNAVESVNGESGIVVLDSDDIAEGITNLYFTEARAIDSALTGYVSGAGTVAATDSILEAIQKLNGNIAALPSGSTSDKETITLIAGDITNQYVDLAEEIVANSLLMHSSLATFAEGVHYSLSLEGGVTRVTFIGPLASAGSAPLETGDVLHFSYLF